MLHLLKIQRPAQCCVVLFIGLACVPVLLYTAHRLNYHSQSALIESDAGNVSHDIGERISEIRTLMTALRGLYYASSDLESLEFRLFSKELRRRTDFITGMGRYENIKHDNRASFEKRISESGWLNFQLTRINSEGQSQTLAGTESYYPISMIEPVTAAGLQLMGADLATVAGLKEQLDYSAQHNEPLLFNMPDNWPLGGDLLLFQPVYGGSQAPNTALKRSRESAGGFWISIDLASLLQSVTDDVKEFDLSVSMENGQSGKMMFSQLASNTDALYLSSLFKRKTFTQEWPSASTSLVITLKRSLGYTAGAIISCLLAFAVILLLAGLSVAHILSVRTRMMERDLSREALLGEREKAEKTLNSVQDSIITLDATLKIAYINPAAVIQFNAKPSNTLGRPLSNIVQFQLVDDSFGIFNVEAALANLAHNSKGEFDVVPVAHSHSDFVLRMTITSSRNHEGDVSGHVIVLRDISHERRLTLKLAYQANHDALTGCSNRYQFEQILAGLIDELPFNNRSHALCYMDLDQFKVINDTCGHRAGDRLLSEMTVAMKMLVRENDVLSRLGGDEFGLLMVNVSREETIAISQRIFEFFQNYIFQHEGHAFAVRASIGIVHIDQSCNNMKDVMTCADIACYAAKDAGRNSMYVYSETDDTMAERSVELSWLPRLQNALQNEEFTLHVQAVASVASDSCASQASHFEFLLRLNNTDGTTSTPWQFIQAAERYDLMREIDKWVIRNAFRIMAELKGGPGGHCSFSINLSGQSAADPTLKSYIQDQLLDFAIDPSKIWFELTETAAISNISIAADLIGNIRSLGAKVALDDFGSGLSSFGYLKNLQVDVIKIDGQFIKEIANNLFDREMVRAIHTVGRTMGITTVAEFVEDQSILDELVSIGIDYAQGYHIGKPCSIKEAIALLAQDQSNAA